MDCSFRQADLADAGDSRIVADLVSAFELNQTGRLPPDPDSDSLIAALRGFPTTHAFICEIPGTGAAGLALCFLGFSTFLRKPLLNIHDFFVLPEFQGRGIGRAFLSFLEDQARLRDWGRITLEVYADNTQARTLYESCGYTGSQPETGRVYYFLQKNM